MWRVSADLETAFRHDIRGEVFCTVWRNGVQIADLAPLDIVSGSVSMTDAPGVRATLDMSVVPAPGLWDLLAPGGVSLRPVIKFRWGIDSENVPLGRYDVEEQSLSYTSDGLLSFTGCPDLWGRVAGRGLDRPEIPRGNAVEIAARFARTAIGIAEADQFITPSGVTVRGQVYERSRSEMVQALLAAAGRRAFVDRAGRLVIDRWPTLNGVPVWEVDAFQSGVLVTADRTRNSRVVRNRIVVTSPEGFFRPVVVEDTDPSSPTRVTGPMGVRTRHYTSPALRSGTQARTAAKILLRRSTGLGADLNLSTAPHWGLEPGDLLDVALPAVNGDGYVAERHLVATVTLPFPQVGQAVTQSITTRSSRPDGGEDIDEEAP